MSWCDKLASTPAVGMRFVPYHQSSASIFQALAPLFDQRADALRLRYSVEQQDTFAIQFITEDGFHYSFDPQRMFVEFRHRMRVKAQSGGPPIAEMLSQARPYTVLLPDVAKKALEAVELASGGRVRRLDRFGVVSTTMVANNDLPPGIARFVKYATRPWRSVLETFDVMLTSRIESNDEYTDRCIHHLKRPEDAEQLMTVKLDFQRTFVTAKAATPDVLRRVSEAVQEGALKYFEDVAEGGRFDEQLIDQST